MSHGELEIIEIPICFRERTIKKNNALSQDIVTESLGFRLPSWSSDEVISAGFLDDIEYKIAPCQDGIVRLVTKDDHPHEGDKLSHNFWRTATYPYYYQDKKTGIDFINNNVGSLVLIDDHIYKPAMPPSLEISVYSRDVFHNAYHKISWEKSIPQYDKAYFSKHLFWQEVIDEGFVENGKLNFNSLYMKKENITSLMMKYRFKYADNAIRYNEITPFLKPYAKRQENDFENVSQELIDKMNFSVSRDLEIIIPEAFHIDIVWARVYEFMKYFCYDFVQDGPNKRLPFLTRHDSDDFFDIVEKLRFYQEKRDIELFKKFMIMSLKAKDNVQWNNLKVAFNAIVFPNSDKEFPYEKGMVAILRYLETTPQLAPLGERLAKIGIEFPQIGQDKNLLKR